MHPAPLPDMALIVDDDRSDRRLLSSLLRSTLGLETQESGNGQDALSILANDVQGRIKLVILDLAMPVMAGFETLTALRQDHQRLPVIVLTGSQSIESAVRAMKMGASDFLTKPLSAERLSACARNALKIGLLSREVARLKPQGNQPLLFTDLIGHAQGLAPCIDIARKAARVDLPVLICGETGTGKEVLARAIHGESTRSNQTFIAVNCGAIPEKLIESTLFGHVKGAFTGAVRNAAGKFQEANGGTIFLDEVGELSPDAQVKLLRVLQQREVEPVGAGRPVPIDVRIISATHRDLKDDVQTGRFREDLLYRLDVVPLILPPLCQRPEDIVLLITNLLRLHAAQTGQKPRHLTPAALEKLQAYAWPGNVRELENVIGRTLALTDDEILDADDFSLTPTARADSQTFPSTHMISTLDSSGGFKPLKTLEHEIVLQALSHHQRNITRAAKALGIAKSTFYARLSD